MHRPRDRDLGKESSASLSDTPMKGEGIRRCRETLPRATVPHRPCIIGAELQFERGNSPLIKARSWVDAAVKYGRMQLRRNCQARISNAAISLLPTDDSPVPPLTKSTAKGCRLGPRSKVRSLSPLDSPLWSHRSRSAPAAPYGRRSWSQ